MGRGGRRRCSGQAVAAGATGLLVMLALALPVVSRAGTPTGAPARAEGPGARVHRGHAHHPVPNEPDVDYHEVKQDVDATFCTREFGIGTGLCTAIGNVSTTPRLKGDSWVLQWWPCGDGPVEVSGCRPGWLAVRITVGDNHLDFFMTGRGQGELYFLRASAPSWDARSAIKAASAPFTGKPGERGGPLFIDVHGDCGYICYDIHLHGYLLFAQVARTFHFSGFLRYASGAEPARSHPFHATLEVFDTPSDPACNYPYLVGAGGCRGTFTADSTAPFRGRGGSIHWRKHNDRYYLQSLLSPGGALSGNYYESSHAFVIVPDGSVVPDWGSDIRTGPDFSAPARRTIRCSRR